MRKKRVFYTILFILILVLSWGLVLSEDYVAECSDGVDNDGDGLIDWQFDLSCVNSTDNSELGVTGQIENGWTNFEPDNTTIIVYISNSTGNDSWDGFSPEWNGTSGPKKTINGGTSLMTTAGSVWVLFKRGDTWQAPTVSYNAGWVWYSGKSPQVPNIYASYGNSTIRPLIKNAYLYIGGGGGAPAVLENFSIIGLDLYSSYTDPSSSEFNSTFATSGLNYNGITLLRPGANIILEDNKISFFGSAMVIQGEGSGFYNVSIRRNVLAHSYFMWWSRPQGVYMENVHNALIEDNIFDHNGWNEDVSGAEATIYNHNLYIQESNRDVIVRGNIFARASSHGVQHRPGGIVENNLFINNALAAFIASSQTSFTNPDIYPSMFNNVVLGGASINGDPRGYGFELIGVVNGTMENNIIANRSCDIQDGGNYGIPISFAGSSTGNATQRIINNVVYNFCGSVYSFYPSRNQITFANNSIQNHLHSTYLLTTYESYPNFTEITGNNYLKSNTSGYFAYMDGYTASGTYDMWVNRTNDTNSNYISVDFPDPNRNIESYMGTLGGTTTVDAFLIRADNLSKYNWDTRFVANTVNEYIREGFGINVSSVSTPSCNNGIRDGGETGVDCGGSCISSCEVSTSLSNGSSSGGGTSGGTQSNAGSIDETSEVKGTITDSLLEKENSFKRGGIYKFEINHDRVKQIEIKLRKDSSAGSIEVTERGESTTKIKLKGKTLGIFDITPTLGLSEKGVIERGIVTFSVPESWIVENKIDKTEGIRLVRLEESSWKYYSSVLLKQEEDEVYYNSEVPGFSEFAIIGLTERELLLEKNSKIISWASLSIAIIIFASIVIAFLVIRNIKLNRSNEIQKQKSKILVNNYLKEISS